MEICYCKDCIHRLMCEATPDRMSKEDFCSRGKTMDKSKILIVTIQEKEHE